MSIFNLKTTFQMNVGYFNLRVRTRELNRHVAPFISEKAFQSDHLLHAMSRFCIEWTMFWGTMWTVNSVTGHHESIIAYNEILSKEWQKPGHVIIFSRKWAFWAVQAGSIPKKNHLAKVYYFWGFFFHVFVGKK